MKRITKKAICIIITAALVCTVTAGTVHARPKEELTPDERVEQILRNMTLKQKVAQMLLVYEPENSKKDQKDYQYGGYVMFANSFQKSNKTRIKKKISGWQKVSKVKMLIAVDEEGGSVVRVSKYKAFRKSAYHSPRYVYNHGGYDAIKSDSRSKAKLLTSLGINTNFAPVADVPYKSSNFIYQRSFSTSAKSTAKFVKLSVKEAKKQNCISTLKHFPGYGNNADTHTGVCIDNRKKSTFENRDLLPFREGIKAGVPMIMVSHNVVKCFDKKNTASLSLKTHKYIRDELGFDGVIITDGLAMQGVRDRYGSDAEIAVKAVKAGNDMLCTPYGKTSVKAITKAVKDGEIDESRINDSVRRILKMKLYYGIIE